MAIKTGRNGKVQWDPAGGAALVPIISVKGFKANFETEYEDVSCFGNKNRVWLPGLGNAEGSLEGFWNSAELALFRAAMATTPGTLQLMPNETESAYFFQGPAYMSASIDASLDAPKISATWKAAGDWVVPGQIVATGAAAGLPGSFTPAGATPVYAIAGMTGITASPATPWTTGQHVEMGDGNNVYWNGTAWAAGIKT